MATMLIERDGVQSEEGPSDELNREIALGLVIVVRDAIPSPPDQN